MVVYFEIFFNWRLSVQNVVIFETIMEPSLAVTLLSFIGTNS